MSSINSLAVRKFQTEILNWYAKNKRDLPWRRDRNPYHILISEVMLQQTRVSRVIPKYEAWLAKFPTVESLAGAKTAEVLALWSGLGYNRRALFLQRAAQAVVLHPSPSSPFPKTPAELQTLPGIGEYTARAIACFAFNQQIAVVDTNIRKVISLKFFEGNPPDTKTLQTVADQLLPKGRAYEWNQALMDYSSAMLSKDKVPIAKQSKFMGSNRYYRGQILKLLIEKQPMTKGELAKIFQTGTLEEIIKGLEKDQLIKIYKSKICLP